MKNKKSFPLLSSVVLSVVVAAVTVALTLLYVKGGVAEAQTKPAATAATANADATGSVRVAVPASARLVIALDKDDNLIGVVDAQGNPAASCQLCSVEMHHKDPGCKKLQRDKSMNICAALTTATVNKIQTMTIIDSHRNPDCKSISFAGRVFVYPSGCSHL